MPVNFYCEYHMLYYFEIASIFLNVPLVVVVFSFKKSDVPTVFKASSTSVCLGSSAASQRITNQSILRCYMNIIIDIHHKNIHSITKYNKSVISLHKNFHKSRRNILYHNITCVSLNVSSNLSIFHKNVHGITNCYTSVFSHHKICNKSSRNIIYLQYHLCYLKCIF